MKLAFISLHHETAVASLDNNVITALTGLKKPSEIKAFRDAWNKFNKKAKKKDWIESFKAFARTKVSLISPQQARALSYT